MKTKDVEQLSESEVLRLWHYFRGTDPYRRCDLLAMMELVRSERMVDFACMTRDEAKCFGMAPL